MQVRKNIGKKELHQRQIIPFSSKSKTSKSIAACYFPVYLLYLSVIRL